jgi:hypothetical protein
MPQHLWQCSNCHEVREASWAAVHSGLEMCCCGKTRDWTASIGPEAVEHYRCRSKAREIVTAVATWREDGDQGSGWEIRDCDQLERRIATALWEKVKPMIADFKLIMNLFSFVHYCEQWLKWDMSEGETALYVESLFHHLHEAGKPGTLEEFNAMTQVAAQDTWGPEHECKPFTEAERSAFRLYFMDWPELQWIQMNLGGTKDV